jgi:hypothetical protein
MRIGGHGFREHLRLLSPLFALIAAVFFLRLIMAAADTPAWIVRIVSVTTTTSAAILLAVVLIHVRQAGGYANVVMASLLINSWAQLLIIGAIVFTVLTGVRNIYTYPEYSIVPYDPNHTRHILGHLSGGVGVGTLEGSAGGCLLLWLLRTFAPVRQK